MGPPPHTSAASFLGEAPHASTSGGRPVVSVAAPRSERPKQQPVGPATSDHASTAPSTSLYAGRPKAGGPSDSLLHRLAGPSDQKAGLGRTRDEIAQIAYSASKGSKFFLQQQQKDAELTVRVDKLRAKLDALVAERHGKLVNEEHYVDEMIQELEKTRDLQHVVCVVDADAFYASCHVREDPSLEGKAFGVGGGSGGGVLTTASYEARKYGCTSAMAGFVAKKLCPHLIFVKPDFSLYTSASKSIMNILRQYGELSPASLDEAYISLTEYCKREKVSPAQAAERIRSQVQKETKLTVSAGVSPNAMLSKVAADKNKPNGQCVIDPTKEACMQFASALPIRKVPGIGRVSERILQAIEVFTVADIYKHRGRLFLIRKEIGLTFLLKTYLGLGRTTISQAKRGSRKSISVERTFSPQSSMQFLYDKLQQIAESLAEDCRKLEYSGRTLTLKLKTHTFYSISRAKTLGSSIYFSDAATFYAEGKRLLDKEVAERSKAISKGGTPKGGKDFNLRLIGLRLSNLRDERSSKTKGSNLETWKGSTKGDSKPDVISLLSSDEDDVHGDDDDQDCKPDINNEGPVDFGDDDDDGVKAEDDVEPKPPASSDPLWAALDGDMPLDFDDHALASNMTNYDLLEKYVEDDVRLANKPFFTIGESLNGRVEQAAPTPLVDRLNLHGNGRNGPTTDKLFRAEKKKQDDDVDDVNDDDDAVAITDDNVGPMQCPVCEKAFVGSEVALTAHVEQHFSGSSKSALKSMKPVSVAARDKVRSKRKADAGHIKHKSSSGSGSSSSAKRAKSTLFDAFRAAS
ncbi:hypothetical protein OIV83_003418 [Microbotryomycetes sp. JL201]|nr:hypothetical protein OIV83_003418 [Microbotryomycetes sp. JL201]